MISEGETDRQRAGDSESDGTERERNAERQATGQKQERMGCRRRRSRNAGRKWEAKGNQSIYAVRCTLYAVRGTRDAWLGLQAAQHRHLHQSFINNLY